MGDIAFVIAGFCALVAIALILVRLGPVKGNADWIYAWAMLLAAGADLVLVPITSWLNVLSPIYDHLFATFLLSGALRFVGRERHLPSLWVVSGVVCLLRLTIQPFMPMITGAISATLVIGVSSLLSFWLLFTDAQKKSLLATKAMSFAFLAPGGVQVYFLVSRLMGDVLSSALFAYVLMGSMLAMAQLTLLLERARRETERNRETLALMAQAAPVGLCLTDPDGNLEAMNPVARSLLNEGVLDKENLPNYLSKLNGETLASDSPSFIVHLNEKVLHVIRQHIPVADQYVGDIWFIEDISARIQLSELIPKAEGLETVKNIAANIAHVFNNQLTVISGSAELIAIKGDPLEMTHFSKYMDRINMAVDECSELIKDFLMLTQEQPLLRSRLDLHQTIAELNKLVELEVVSTGNSAVLDVDAAAFSRAFKELFANAEEAGASTVSIHTDLEEDGFLRLTIRDDGCGIDEGLAHRVLEPFFSTKEQPLGSGLGLSVVDSIVRAHGGKTKIRALREGLEISTTWPVLNE